MAPGAYEAALDRAPFAVTACNPNLPDTPIVYANAAFLALTGYRREAVIGRNCRFLQSPCSDDGACAPTGHAMATGHGVTADLVTLRADGTPFLDRQTVVPLHQGPDRIALYLRFHLEITDGLSATGRAGDLGRRIEAMHGRLRGHAARLIGMIRDEAQHATDTDRRARILAERWTPLGLLREQMDAAGPGGDLVRLDAYLGRVCAEWQRLAGRPRVAVSFFSEAVALASDRAALLGIALTELLIGALRRACPNGRAGRIEATLEAGTRDVTLVFEDDLPPQDMPLGWSDDLSTRMLRSLARRPDTDISVRRAREGSGTQIVIRIARTDRIA